MARRSDRLEIYKAKRRFDRTPEPRGGRFRRQPAPSFVVQKHDATRLHYDVRLEVDGVLKSWAVPKGPSFDPTVRRLAVPTEDHPMDYADFEGVIPEGEYGGGPVIVWDRGAYRSLEKDFAKALEEGSAKFELEGEKLRGAFAIVRAHGRGDRPMWLMLKLRDERAEPSYDPVAERPESVLSGRLVEEVAAGKSVARAHRKRRAREPSDLRPTCRLPKPMAAKRKAKRKTTKKKTTKKKKSRR